MYGKTQKVLLSVALAAALVFIFFSPVIDADNGNQPPRVDFSWTPDEDIKTGETVDFTDESEDPDGNIVAWKWVFDDGDTSARENPSHTYTDDGTYEVNLTVTDNNGTQNFTIKTIEIENRPPIADAGPEQMVNTSTVSFNGTGSRDPDGSIQQYDWQFDDGGTGTGSTPTHTYDADGRYNVTLNVTDDDGASDENITKVTVDTAAPETTATLNGTEGSQDWYTSNVTVTLTAEDNVSGVDAIYYKVNDGNWTVYQTSFTITAEGANVLRYYAVDDAGNTETTKNVTIKIDKTKPSVTITTPEEGYIYLFGRRLIPTIRGNTLVFGRITIEASVNASPADVDKVRFQIDGTTQYTDFNGPYEWRWGLAFGRHTVGVKAYDMAGQNSTTERDISIISLLPGSSSTDTTASPATDTVTS